MKINNVITKSFILLAFLVSMFYFNSNTAFAQDDTVIITDTTEMLEFEDLFIISNGWRVEDNIDLFFHEDEDLTPSWSIDEGFGVDGYYASPDIHHIVKEGVEVISRHRAVGLMLSDKNIPADKYPKAVINTWQYRHGKNDIPGDDDSLLMEYSSLQAAMINKGYLAKADEPELELEHLNFTIYPVWQTIGINGMVSIEPNNFVNVYKITYKGVCCEYRGVLRYNNYVVAFSVFDYLPEDNYDMIQLMGEVIRNMLMDFDGVIYLPTVSK